jgi:hexosaminidase
MNARNTRAAKTVICMVMMALCSGSSSGQSTGATLRLVPYPQQVEIQTGEFVPPKDLLLTHDQSQKEIGHVADTCIQDLAGIGFSASQGTPRAKAQAGSIELSLQNDPSLGQEGYRLKIESTVSISAATLDGLFWGTRTLLQLMHAGPQKGIPQLTIIDKPEFEYRGLLIDNARRFHTMDFHIDTIKRMAAFKLNRYQIHFSDHESYTLPSAAFPNLPTQNRHYTPEEIRRLVHVARQYHVMIVPEIDVPGHAGALLRGIKGLGCEGGGGKLCIGREETYEVLETLFTEIMGMIPGSYWHLGADEVSYDGTRCPRCAARMTQEDLKTGVQLYHYFINRMHGSVKGQGRQMFVWEGFSPTLDPEIDKDIMVCPFDVKHHGHMPSDYFKAGYRVLNTAWSPLYVADNLYMTTPEILARWSPYMFGAGRSPQPLAYWKKFKPEAYQGRIMGGQMCSWAIEEKAEEGLLFGTGPGFPN